MTKRNFVLLILLLVGISNILLGQNRHNFKGRIAWSTNTNSTGAAEALALAIFAEAGVKDSLIHFNYNPEFVPTSTNQGQTNAKGLLGAAQLYGYNTAVFYNNEQAQAEAIQNICDAVNASSENTPLYFIISGSMEIPFLGISAADPEKTKHVYCISSNASEQTFTSGQLTEHNKRDIIETGARWIQIKNQDLWLKTGFDEQSSADKEKMWKPWYWMRDSEDKKVRFIWELLEKQAQPDARDAGMAYFLMSGDEVATLPKTKSLIIDKTRINVIENRKKIRIEAENFQELTGFKIDYNPADSCSKALCVKHSSRLSFSLSTEFKEVYVKERNNFDIRIRFIEGRLNRAVWDIPAA